MYNFSTFTYHSLNLYTRLLKLPLPVLQAFRPPSSTLQRFRNIHLPSFILKYISFRLCPLPIRSPKKSYMCLSLEWEEREEEGKGERWRDGRREAVFIVRGWGGNGGKVLTFLHLCIPERLFQCHTTWRERRKNYRCQCVHLEWVGLF